MEQKKLTGYPSIDKPWLKYYTEEAINAALPECTAYEYLWINNKENLDDIALSYFDRRITFGVLFENIEKAAKALAALGLRSGDIVVMSAVTTPETIYAFYGLNRLGAISNMIDPRTSTEGITNYITEVHAKFVLTIDVALPKIEKAIIGTDVQKIIVISPADSLPQPKKALYVLFETIKGKMPRMTDRCIKWSDLIMRGKNETPTYCSYQKDACCVIVHTGGTTGTPKGVMLSNDNLNAMALQYRLLGVAYDRKQCFLNIMPPFIAYGIVCGVHVPLVLGLIDVLIPKFNPEEFAELVIKYKPAHMLGVPAHFEKLKNDPKVRGYNLDFFESAGAGGDSISESFENEINTFLKEHHGKYPIAKGYGMTEISSAAAACHGNINKIGSAGIPHLKTIISVFRPETSDELKYGESGEICMTAPTVMLGYYNQQSETHKILRIHSDGKVWIHSGDIGHMDEDGFLYIDGRLKRLIVRHDGFKVFPSQIENVILKNINVESCCVVGVADKGHYQGQRPVAFVVNKGDDDNAFVESELRELCHKELPEYAQPIGFVFQKSLPLTPIGKIDYRVLEELAEK